MNRKMTPDELEQFIHRQLRGLPPRRAPRTLESRVLAAIEQRAAVAWYHKSYAYWPAPVRAAFLTLATAGVGGVMTAAYLLMAGTSLPDVTAQVGSRLGGVMRLVDAATWTFDLCGRLFASIPPLWLYGGAALVTAMYVAFFGLGAAAYRAFYRSN